MLRDNAVVYTTPEAHDSTFWQMSSLSFVDSTVTAGSHTYVVRAIDPLGNTTTSAAATVTVP